MSVNALTCINDVAALIGDPAFSRIRTDAWQVILNRSARDCAKKLRCVLWKATFDIVAQDHEYALPADCVQIKRVQVNETPSDQTAWWDVDEMFEDEYRRTTNGQYASATRPSGYMAWPDTLDLYPLPDTAIAAGGCLTYWGLPDDVTAAATQPIPFSNIYRDTLMQRMEHYGWKRLREYDAAAEIEKEWQASLTVDRDRVEDRSADRRSRIRTRPGNLFGQR